MKKRPAGQLGFAAPPALPPMTPGEAVMRRPLQHPTIVIEPCRAPWWGRDPVWPWEPPPPPTPLTDEPGEGGEPSETSEPEEPTSGGYSPFAMDPGAAPAGQVVADPTRWSLAAAAVGAAAFGLLAWLSFSTEAREGPERRRQIAEGRAALRRNPRRNR